MTRLGDYGKTVVYFLPRSSPYVPADHVHIWQEWGRSGPDGSVTWRQCACGARTRPQPVPNLFARCVDDPVEVTTPHAPGTGIWRRLLHRVGLR